MIYVHPFTRGLLRHACPTFHQSICESPMLNRQWVTVREHEIVEEWVNVELTYVAMLYLCGGYARVKQH